MQAPGSENQKQNEQFFRNVYPETWLSKSTDRSQNKLHWRYQETTLDKLECFENCTLLESGCASGELLYRLSTKIDHSHLYGIDIGRYDSVWSELLKHPNIVSISQSDAIRLPFASNTFDRALCSSVSWYISDPRTAISELIRVLKVGGRFVFDVRNPYHITNILAQLSLLGRRFTKEPALKYTFFTPSALTQFLQTLPIKFEISGYFVLLPTRLPVLGEKRGNLAQYSPWLSFKAGHGAGLWLSQKILVSGVKVELS